MVECSPEAYAKYIDPGEPIDPTGKPSIDRYRPKIIPKVSEQDRPTVDDFLEILTYPRFTGVQILAVVDGFGIAKVDNYTIMIGPEDVDFEVGGKVNIKFSAWDEHKKTALCYVPDAGKWTLTGNITSATKHKLTQLDEIIFEMIHTYDARKPNTPKPQKRFIYEHAQITGFGRDGNPTVVIAGTPIFISNRTRENSEKGTLLEKIVITGTRPDLGRSGLAWAKAKNE
jgi:hypothetical protein